MFRALIILVMPQLDHAVPHERPEGVGEGGNSDGELFGQVLQGRTCFVGESLNPCEQPDLRGFETCRRHPLVVQLSKPAGGTPEGHVGAREFTKHIYDIGAGSALLFPTTDWFSHPSNIVEHRTIAMG